MAACFTRLRIAGFKSFAEPVELEILPGLTGIVGPNGCGKSNVAEALRWTMGEGSARSMRGGEMDDVIFGGSITRPSRNLAEATITLTATTPFPPPFQDAPELQVSRRIERGAGSTYRVNGREARARDIQVLFADLASGARSSAMVSQGRVGALVAARPEERRAVLDEAAGIGGLHTRRAEAESKLRAAETNLGRAQDRLDQLTQMQATLTRQAQHAARYRVLTTQIEQHEQALANLRYAQVAAAHTAAAQAMTKAHASTEAAEGAAQQAAIAHAQAVARLPAFRAAEAAARDGSVQARMAEDARAAAHTRHSLANAQAAAAHTRCAADLAHAQRAVVEADAASARHDAEAGRLGMASAAYPTALAQAQMDAKQTRGMLDTQESLVAHTTAAAAQIGAARTLAAVALEQAGQRHRRAQATAARLQADRVRCDPIAAEAVADAAQAAQTAQTTLDAASAALDQAETRRATTTPDQARALESAAAAAHARVMAETTALSEVLEPAPGSATPLLDHMQVAPGLESALGAAFGDTLEAGLNQGPRHWQTTGAGPDVPVTDCLLTHVRAPPALHRALAAIVIVGSAEEARVRQPALGMGLCLVTQDGGAWRWDGYVVEPGAPTAAATRLRQRNRLSALQQDVAMRRAVWHDARTARAAAEHAADAAREVERQARLNLRNAAGIADQTRATAAAMQQRAATATARLLALDTETTAIAPELSDAAAALQQAETAMAHTPDPAAVSQAAAAARAALSTIRAAAATAATALDRIERDAAAREVRLISIERERADWLLRQRDTAGRVQDLAARLIEAKAMLATLAATLAATAPMAAEGGMARRVADTAHHVAIADTKSAERTESDALLHLQMATRTASTAREALARAERDAAHADEAWRAWTGPAWTGPAGSNMPPADLSPAAEERARQRLDRAMRERTQIGPVNLLAETEAQDAAAAASTIAQDRDELGTAIAKLRGSIGHLNREGRQRLVAVFETVDRHFQALFTRMFGGGRAHLALVGSDDALLAGLEIYVQPPGKKLAALSLLSGGEQALTALCLIFAVFRCNPAPVCVLDEVDAPLDDTNVERFCALLDDMVTDAGTRFLVVTHHQLTMARMDRLYGVTMQERGVSRLLSVTLDRAVALIEDVRLAG